MVLDAESILKRVAGGMSTARDAAVLADMLGRHSARWPQQLADHEVKDLRETWQRWRLAGTASRQGPDGKGYGAIGKIYGINPRTAKDLLAGRTRRAAGGPIDASIGRARQ